MYFDVQMYFSSAQFLNQCKSIHYSWVYFFLKSILFYEEPEIFVLKPKNKKLSLYYFLIKHVVSFRLRKLLNLFIIFIFKKVSISW